ncbi:class I SAM-dependent methyltransferase [Myxococcus sp. K38C18041901]|uniref:class I SAM-dependent methyltransferase n=1 Tax=Myxococcus guangdongensis TaxID=2906760 RepID=UPI0020A7C739|nr:methyltransferase domain-containing protein [Myxococcus guangdongensis]MCP3063655.1 class I SAM-dependent methyltransferase [Myxococcus guangdongensis]
MRLAWDTALPLHPRHPLTGLPLTRVSPELWSDGATRWPVVDGIPFLRTGREALREAVVAALERGEGPHARALLLRDQDDHARVPPPSLAATASVVAGVEAGTLGLRDALEQLGFGPVAPYFAHRQSAPTFLSALGLLAQHWDAPPCVVELACGLGQVLREVSLRGTPVVGVDVVFAKLWLARHFIVPEAVLLCADAAADVPIPPLEGATVLCHDALYFLTDKARVLAELRRVAGSSGRVLVGHAHNRHVDQRGVGGTPLSPSEYAALMPGAACYDDAAFVTRFLEGGAVPDTPLAELERAEALSFAWPSAPGQGAIDFGVAVPGARLSPNPLLEEHDGRVRPAWPTPGLAAEYASAHYLRSDAPEDVALLRRSATGATAEQQAALVRRRWLLNLPGRW